MKSKMPMITQLLGIQRESMRGDSIFAFLIFLVVLILLVNTFATAWQNIIFQKNLEEKAQINTLRGVGSVLARSSEALLTAGELSQLRRSISEAGLKHDFESCRIVLPDGGVLAASDPTRINTLTFPETWDNEEVLPEEILSDHQIQMTFPLDVAGKGTARLELSARLGQSLLSTLQPHATQMAIACLGLAIMLLVHRQARLKLKAISAIHEALCVGAGWRSRHQQPRIGSQPGTRGRGLEPPATGQTGISDQIHPGAGQEIDHRTTQQWWRTEPCL